MINLLTEKKKVLLDNWFDAVLRTYPGDSAKFFKKQKNQFANPMGHTFYTNLESIVTAFVEKEEESFGQSINPNLEEIMKIRSVQDFSPAQAVLIFILFKEVVRDELKRMKALDLETYLKLENRMDRLTLQAFNMYVSCREKLYELRVQETKRSVYRLVNQMAKGSDHVDKELVEKLNRGDDPIST